MRIGEMAPQTKLDQPSSGWRVDTLSLQVDKFDVMSDAIPSYINRNTIPSF